MPKIFPKVLPDNYLNIVQQLKVFQGENHDWVSIIRAIFLTGFPRETHTVHVGSAIDHWTLRTLPRYLPVTSPFWNVKKGFSSPANL